MRSGFTCSSLLVWSFVFLVAACGDSDHAVHIPGDIITNSDAMEESDPCLKRESVGTWFTVGHPFILSWCRGCHSRDLPTGSRGGAPLEVNFDKKNDILKFQDRIVVRLQNASMPPSTELPDWEVEEFLLWLSCGAP